VTAAVFKNSGFVGCFAICVKIYGNSLLHIVYLI
jgi:cytochrome c551/c552